MKCKLVKIPDLSGKEASFYSVIINDELDSLFDQFIKENKNSFLSELKNIIKRLNTIGHKTGAREGFFKLHEGSLGDGVCALYDEPDKMLRLYCIRYAKQLVILGGGGPKKVKTYQEDEKLLEENQFLQWLSHQIKESMSEGQIEFDNDFRDFSGDLTIQDYEEN